MPSRRFHGKTRTGCTSCKARHVKCGEERPICHHCTRRSTTCIYPGDSHTSSSRTHVVPQQHRAAAASSAGSSRPSPPSNGLAAPDAFDSLDLTLMHRYATSTSTRLLITNQAQAFWQVLIPSMAESSIILQRGILALAAMDLACEAADEKNTAKMAMYRSRSLHHQQTALPQFRSLLENQHQSYSDQQTIFVFSIFLLFLAFASAHSAETKPTVDEILDLFALFRGPKMLWQIAYDTSNREMIDAIFPTPLHRTADISEQDAPDPYPALRALDLDEAAEAALTKLTESWRFSQLMRDDVRCMAWFPACVPDAFCMQVRQRQPNSLAVLSEYTGIIRPFRELWWIRSWDRVLDEAIQAVVREEGIMVPGHEGSSRVSAA